MTQPPTDKELDKKEAEHAIRNYTRVANMLVDGYHELHPQDKWLFVCLDRLCGKAKNRYLSLRYIAKRTGFSQSVLSDDKKNGKIGMIMRLHNAGLIHAEIKRRKNSDGELEKNAQYHITITDTWALNYAFYNDPQTCSDSEQVIDEDSDPVLNQNDPVLFQNGIGQTCSEIERTRSDSGTIVRLHSKTTDSNKITEQDSIHTPFSFSSEEEMISFLEAKGLSVTPKEDYKENTKNNNKEECVPPTSQSPQDETSVSSSHTPFSDSHENAPPPEEPKKKRSLKPAKPKIDAETQKRIDRVYEFFDKLGQEATKTPDYSYRRTQKATEDIIAWLKTKPTEAILREVYFELWNSPKDPKSGFDWKEHMTIHSVLNQYDTRFMAIRARLNQQAARHVTYATKPFVPAEEEDDTPFVLI